MIQKNLKILFVLLGLAVSNLAIAGEGMWLPLLLQSLNEAEMKSMGMKMSAEDIYSINKGSLKDAIVHFNGGCTSEIISGRGLLLTNHHCGYSQIQSHSSLENNYLRDGFWAKSLKDELVNNNLSATFIQRIEDVSKDILKGVTDAMNDKDRQSLIDQNMEKFKLTVKKEAYEDIVIRPFYKGNQYFMFVTLTYRDVRLVGAPPESVGKFGSDTDNWVWPRHTGDFSIFRIYADKNNLPAEYAEDNVPYTPKHFLPISLDGVEEGDFTMVFGFPGRTNQYLPSYAVSQIVDVLNPAKIGIRDRALKIVDAEMRADPQVKIQYASKFASIANYWKKWIGESQGLKSTNALDKKHQFEKEFMAKVNANAQWKDQYAYLLPEFKKLYAEIEPYALTRDYFNETAFRNIELLRVVNFMNNLVTRFDNNGETGYNDYKARLQSYLKGFYKNYRANIDQKVASDLLGLFDEKVPIDIIRQPLKEAVALSGTKSLEDFTRDMYKRSNFTTYDKVLALFEKSPKEAVAAIKADPAFKFGTKMMTVYDNEVGKKYNAINSKISTLQRLYMKAIIEVFPDKRFYPDANGTMRVSYGKVASYEPKDAVKYLTKTYLSGVMDKYVPGDYEFDVPEKLRTLYQQKDYGPYADKNGKMPVCFIGSNHTTGGNSGSPAIDAHGNLIGLNFDRVWEGTMSDINYDASICRNIMVDVRYILFFIDKYAGADYLIKEMKLVHPKKK